MATSKHQWYMSEQFKSGEMAKDISSNPRFIGYKTAHVFSLQFYMS